MALRFSAPLLMALLLAVPSSVLASSDQLRVVASIKPVHSILSGLMKGAREPELIVATGQTPYGYELTPEQQKSLAAADLVVWVGPELEKFLIDPLQGLPAKTRVITLLDSPGLKILPSLQDDDARDPFFWLDSRNAIILIDELTRELIAGDPGRAHLFRRNRDALFAKVAELDRRLEYGYRGLKGGAALAYYNTLAYFEQAYALKIGGMLRPSPEVPVDAGRLLQERAKLAAGEYACLFTEANMEMPELPLLSKDIEINVVELDSFGSTLTPGENLYLELMDHNTSLIKACVQKSISSNTPEVTASPEPTIRKIGGKFMLMDHQGNMVSDKDMLGKYQLINFGYTYCPDVCPTSLQVMTSALKRLGEKADRIQPYFITVDPQRDTQAQLARYVGYFGENLIGLTGRQTMIDRIIKVFNLRVEKVMEEGMDADNYLVDHTASIFLMAPDGRFITKFAYGISTAQMVEKLNEYVR